MPTDKIARLRQKLRRRAVSKEFITATFDKDGYQSNLKDINGEKLPSIKALRKNAVKTPFTKSCVAEARRNQVPATVALRSSIQWRKAVKGSMPTAKHYTIFIAKVNAANEVTEVDCAFHTYYKHSPNGTQHFPYWMPASEGLKLFPKP
jgi:hypothetical protein